MHFFLLFISPFSTDFNACSCHVLSFNIFFRPPTSWRLYSLLGWIIFDATRIWLMTGTLSLTEVIPYGRLHWFALKLLDWRWSDSVRLRNNNTDLLLAFWQCLKGCFWGPWRSQNSPEVLPVGFFFGTLQGCFFYLIHFLSFWFHNDPMIQWLIDWISHPHLFPPSPWDLLLHFLLSLPLFHRERERVRVSPPLEFDLRPRLGCSSKSCRSQELKNVESRT